jgi:hypothetical protein
MAQLLHEKGHDAIAMSESLFFKIKRHLPWVDRVIRMDEAMSMCEWIQNSEYYNGWIGRDKWGNPNHPVLIEKCKKKLEELGL